MKLLRGYSGPRILLSLHRLQEVGKECYLDAAQSFQEVFRARGGNNELVSCIVRLMFCKK